MSGMQIENLLTLLEAHSPLDRVQARRQVVEYLNTHAAEIAQELEEKGEAVIHTTSGNFRLTKEDLVAA